MSTLRQAAQQALEALEGLADYRYTERVKNTMASLRAALAEPEQEPVAWVDPKWIDPDTRWWPSDSFEALPIEGWLPLYTAPPQQREHITDGSPCWCNPDVIEEEGGNVIVHNYEDNWQQYAKPGETAQQCIERHRAEQDALMKLYSTPRKPLDTLEISLIWGSHSAQYNPYADDGLGFARAIEAAHGITGEQHE